LSCRSCGPLATPTLPWPLLRLRCDTTNRRVAPPPERALRLAYSPSRPASFGP